MVGEFRGFRAYRSLAGVVLSVTGAEALYADMGHFGAGADIDFGLETPCFRPVFTAFAPFSARFRWRGPISVAWIVLVYPCLTLQYLGQAVVIAETPELINQNPL